VALIVQKYGGTSVGSIEHIQAVAKKVKAFADAGNKLVVSVSAMSGETNRMTALAQAIQDTPSLREMDVLLTTGEQVSISLLAMALQQLGCNAILTLKNVLGKEKISKMNRSLFFIFTIMQFNLFTLIFLITTFAYVVTMMWLNTRQAKSMLNSFDKVPNEFAAKITLEQHQKAADYTTAKLKVNHLEILFSTGVLLAWTLGGGLDYLDGIWHSLTSNTLYIGVGFIISLIVIGTLIDLPFSLYRTFVLEAKFGFNKTTVGTLVSDMIKGFMLALVIGAPLLYGILYLMNAMGEYWWLSVWLLLTGFSLLMLWLYPTFIAKLT
jgi:hypothetical protein